MPINRKFAKYISVAALVVAALVGSQRANPQALNVYGRSGIFFQTLAEIIPSSQSSWVGL
jgi:hypothetical protein